VSGVVTRQIRVSGLVQGVGFRAAMRAEAQRLGVAGWVRNRADGSVEALVQGAAPAVDAVVAWARRGPPGARVADVRISEAPAQAGLAGFAALQGVHD
jgi:acylphosphatase